MNEPAERWTIREVARWTAEAFDKLGIGSARLDAEILIAHALGIDRVKLFLDIDRPLSSAERGAVRELVARRMKYEPVAYIVGYKEFYGLRFEVNTKVLIPRPETELLVDEALNVLKGQESSRVLDLCTGSGAIAVAIASRQQAASLDATDISTEALELAQRNAQALGVAERVDFCAGDLFAACKSGTHYDLIVSNPPYIATGLLEELQPDIRNFEPQSALLAGPDGCDFYRRILQGSPEYLKQGGALLLELGDDLLRAVRLLLAFQPKLQEEAVIADLAGKPRVLRLRRRGD